MRAVVALLALSKICAQLPPYVSESCESSLQLVRKRRMETAIATLWIEEPIKPHRRLLPRAFRNAALERLEAFLCAVRAVSSLPVLVGVANVDAGGQASICDPARDVGVLNLTAVDTRAVFRPVYDVEEATREKMWFNLTTPDGVANHEPQRRTDGWKTRFKFALFNCTRWAAQIVYLDLDVVLLADPAPAARRWARKPLVSAYECSYRSYVGMHASVFVFNTDAGISQQLFAKSLEHDYLVYTNGDQDVMEAFWCSYVTALPGTAGRSPCAVKARHDAPFKRTFQGAVQPVFISGATMTGADGIAHIHDAYVRRGRCVEVAARAGVSAGACACLRPDKDRRALVSEDRRRRLSVYGQCRQFANEAAPGLSKEAYLSRERDALYGA